MRKITSLLVLMMLPTLACPMNKRKLPYKFGKKSADMAFDRLHLEKPIVVEQKPVLHYPKNDAAVVPNESVQEEGQQSPEKKRKNGVMSIKVPCQVQCPQCPAEIRGSNSTKLTTCLLRHLFCTIHRPEYTQYIKEYCQTNAQRNGEELTVPCFMCPKTIRANRDHVLIESVRNHCYANKFHNPDDHELISQYVANNATVQQQG